VIIVNIVNNLWIAAMVFQPGQSGNPSGGRGRKLIIDAVNSLVTLPWDGQSEVDLGEIPEKLTIAHALAYRLVSGALRNDYEPGESLAYFKEICDRVYGKPKNSDDSENNNPSVQINVTQQILSVMSLEQLEIIKKQSLLEVNSDDQRTTSDSSEDNSR
jgi:hypothetical protein